MENILFNIGLNKYLYTYRLITYLNNHDYDHDIISNTLRHYHSFNLL